MLYEVRGDDEKTMYRGILSVLDREHMRLSVVERASVASIGAGDL